MELPKRQPRSSKTDALRKSHIEDLAISPGSAKSSGFMKKHLDRVDPKRSFWNDLLTARGCVVQRSDQRASNVSRTEQTTRCLKDQHTTGWPSDWLTKRVLWLARGSVVYAIFDRVSCSLFRRHLIRNPVAKLKHNPFSMFLYNLRTVFLVLTLVICTAVFLAVRLSSQLKFDPIARQETFLLLGTTIAVIVSGYAIRYKLIIQLRDWTWAPPPMDPPSAFFWTLYVDLFLLGVFLVLGLVLHLRFAHIALAPFMYMVLLGVFPTKRRGYAILLSSIVFALLAAAYFRFANIVTDWKEASLYHSILTFGATGGILLFTLFSIVGASRLWLMSRLATVGRFEFLKLAEETLGKVGSNQPKSRDEPNPRTSWKESFCKPVSDVLRSLCGIWREIWYHSACLWLMEPHQDKGNVLVCGPTSNFPSLSALDSVIPEKEIASDFLCLAKREPLVLMSLKNPPSSLATLNHRFYFGLDAPAAFVPLLRTEEPVGILAVYGEDGGPSIGTHEEPFLESVAAIIADALEQNERRLEAEAHQTMDDLFRCSNLPEVFKKAVKIMADYLAASGCMVLFRPNPHNKELRVVARLGFSSKVDPLVWSTEDNPLTRTMKCAVSGQTDRCDDVPAHAKEFNQERLQQLEEALGEARRPKSRPREQILSWMIVPIGPQEDNYGAIKVVNKTGRTTWFTKADEELGKTLALCLHVIIQKFLQIEKTETARQQATTHAEEAKQQAALAEKAKEDALKLAEDRENILMTITHQVYQPLTAVIGALSTLSLRPLSQSTAQLVSQAYQFAEDAFCSSYGTYTSLARERKEDQVVFRPRLVHIPNEMRSLCERLRNTCSRPDLSFRYEQNEDFPDIQIDRDVFISVLYSLIHNAMKYARRDSTVHLKCTFEYPIQRWAVKVKSEGIPIQPHEIDSIFEMFKRGYMVRSTQQRYPGVGLGLWVARELMRAMSGDLTVELSHDQPELSVFVIHLPTQEGRIDRDTR